VIEVISRKAYDEARPFHFTKAPHHRAQVLNAFQNQDRVLVEQAAGLGEAHGTTVAVEQRDAQFRFQGNRSRPAGEDTTD
jgi:hypothetical protein